MTMRRRLQRLEQAHPTNKPGAIDPRAIIAAGIALERGQPCPPGIDPDAYEAARRELVQWLAARLSRADG